MNDWTDVLTVAALRPWMQIAPGLLLAAVRWLGCLLWLPVLGAAGVTIRMRIALALLLSIVMLPAAILPAGEGAAGQTPGAVIAAWLAAACGEFVLGCMLGLGVRVLFSALAVAGELIDQQAGLVMRQVFDPLGAGEAGPTGGALAWLGVVALLGLPAAEGHLGLVETMLGHFTAVPVGSVAGVPASTLLVVLVEQSLRLALEVAAPVLAVMSLITLAVGWLGRSAPRLRAESLVAPVRAAVCVTILVATVPGAGALFADRLIALGTGSSELLRPSGGMTSLTDSVNQPMSEVDRTSKE